MWDILFQNHPMLFSDVPFFDVREVANPNLMTCGYHPRSGLESFTGLTSSTSKMDQEPQTTGLMNHVPVGPHERTERIVNLLRVTCFERLKQKVGV